MIIEENLKTALQNLYGFKNPTIFKEIESGYTAESFVIEDGPFKFFVKKYHSKRLSERLLEIHHVKEYFNNNGVPTIPPLVNTKSTTLSESDGKFFAVFPHVSGKQYYDLPSNKAVASAGENLAKLHRAGTNNLALISHKTFKPWNKEAFLEKATKMLTLARAGATAFDKVAKEMLELKIKLAEGSDITYGDLGLKNDVVLHGDYHTHNLFFDENDNVSYTFDFERTMVGPRTTDVAYGLFMICFDFNTDIGNNVSEIHFDSAHSFIQAYNSNFPIDIQKFLNKFKNGISIFGKINVLNVLILQCYYILHK